MNLVYKVTTAPTAEPLSLEEAKRQLIIESDTTRDVEIAELIAAARMELETLTRRRFVQQTITAYMPAFPSGRIVELPAAPLLSVVSVKYRDDDDAEQTLSGALYNVDTVSEPGRIELKSGQSWPSTYSRWDAVTVELTAGYGADTTDVPADIKRMMKLLVQHSFDVRVAVSAGNTIPRAMPFSLQCLINQKRVPLEWILDS